MRSLTASSNAENMLSLAIQQMPIPAATAGRWLLEILARASQPVSYEPDVPGTLAFYAHGHFSRDARAVRRLIDLGRSDIALAAATERRERVEGMEALLLELGASGNGAIVRRVAWHLAYYYQVVLPEGIALGYVERMDDLVGVEVFLLFREPGRSGCPYAAVLYPQRSGRRVMQMWVDRLFPFGVRGWLRDGDPQVVENGLEEYHYERGWVQYYPIVGGDDWEKVIINYRWDTPWNPKFGLLE